MIFIYFVAFIASLLLLLMNIISGAKDSTNQSFGIAVLTITNGGYIALTLSQNLAEAILAQKIIYIGACFIPMVYFLLMCEICRVKLNNKIVALMYSVQIVIFLLVCTIGSSTLYYKSVEYAVFDNMTYLIKEYGPLHTLYPITLYGYTTAMLILVIYFMKKRTIASAKNLVFSCIAMAFVGISLVIFRLFNLKFDLMGVLETVIMFFALNAVNKIRTYSIMENQVIIESRVGAAGYVVFDKNMIYMGCNEFSANLYPELKKYEIDSWIPRDNSDFNNQILERVKNFAYKDPNDTATYEVEKDNTYFRYTVRYYYDGNNKNVGFIVEIEDITEHKAHIKMVEEYNKQLSEDVANKTHQIQEIQNKTLLGMAQMVESRDLSTGGHIRRTSSVVGIFSKALLKANIGFDEGFLKYVEKSAPMHDLGKIAVEDKILRKQGKFTDEEYEAMKEHSAAGAKIVADILTDIEDEEFVKIATNIAHYHHEKINGRGYPDGLSGDDIPIEARIMALADVFDALVSKRCYKEAFSFDRAFNIIKEDSGSHFDPVLSEIFISCREELENFYLSTDIS